MGWQSGASLGGGAGGSSLATSKLQDRNSAVQAQITDMGGGEGALDINVAGGTLNTTSHLISADETGNSTKVLLGASATFTGAWEAVSDYTNLSVAILGSLKSPGTLWIESSQDGGSTVNSVPFTVENANFDLPHNWNLVESHIRIKYVNGPVAQTGTFQLQTKYSNGQELGLLQNAGDTIGPNTDVQIVKSVVTGANPQNKYVNTPESGVDINNSTVGTLGNAGVFTGKWSRVDYYAEIKTSFNANVNGTSCFMQFSPGSKGLLTFTGQPANDETVTIGAVVYKFKTAITAAANDVLIGASTSDSIDNLVAAICRTGTPGTDYSHATYVHPLVEMAARDTAVTSLIIGSIVGGELATTKVLANATWGNATMQMALERSIAVPPQANSLQTNFGGVHTVNPILPWYRVVYTNNSVAQTDFTLTTIFGKTTGEGLISRATQIVNRYNDVKLQRIINDPDQDRNFGLIGYQSAKRKFGAHHDVPNSFQTISQMAEANDAITHVWLQAAETVRVLAGNTNDTSAGTGARTVTVFGLDENWNEAEEDITLAGTSPSSATTTTFIRINKMSVKTVGTYAGSNTGNIKLEGVTSNNFLAQITTGMGNTQQAIYSVPAGFTCWVTKIKVSVGQGNSADVRMFHNDVADDVSTPFDSVKHFEWGVEDYSGANEFVLKTFLKFNEKNDIFFDAQKVTGSGTAQVSVDYEYILTANES